MIDWSAYRDPVGFLSGQRAPNGSDGNAMLFAAHEKRLRVKLGDWSDGDEAMLMTRIRRLCEKKAGLILRPPPFSQDQDSVDDFIGYASISPSLAGDALRYGRANLFRPKIFGSLIGFRYHYSILSDEQDVVAWLGRFPALIAHFQFAAGETPWLWRRLWWFFSVAFSGSRTNQDPWILNWQMLETEGGKSLLGRAAFRIYRWRLNRNWVGLAHVFSEYLRDPNHPIVLACEALEI